MFARIIKKGDKFYVKVGFWPFTKWVSNGYHDSPFTYSLDFTTRFSFNSLKEAENAWAESKAYMIEEKKSKKSSFIKILK